MSEHVEVAEAVSGRPPMRRYRYLGDRLTDPLLLGRGCAAVLRPDGRCIRGRGAMLVLFDGERLPRVVIARLLRKEKGRDD